MVVDPPFARSFDEAIYFPDRFNGFEVPVVTEADLWELFPSGGAGMLWTVEWYGGSETHEGEDRPETALLELIRRANRWSPYIGEQWVELDGDWANPLEKVVAGPPASVKIYQDFKTVAEKRYRVKYAWSPRPEHDDNMMEVWWGGALIAEHSASGYGDTSWRFETKPVIGPVGSPTRLEFIEVGTPDSKGMHLDAVAISAGGAIDPKVYGRGENVLGETATLSTIGRCRACGHLSERTPVEVILE